MIKRMTGFKISNWLVVTSSVINQIFTAGVLIYSFALFSVLWAKHFQVKTTEIMLAILLFNLAMGACSPLIGRAFDQMSARNMVVCGVSCISVGLFLLSKTTRFWQVVLLYSTLLPMGYVLCSSMASQIIVSRKFKSNRGLALGITATGTSLGGVLLPQLIASLFSIYDWKTTLQILSLFACCTLIPLNLWTLRQSLKDKDLFDLTQKHEAKNLSSYEILRSKVFWILISALVVLNASFSGMQYNLGIIVDKLGYETSITAKLISLTAGSTIVGKIIFGFLGDRVDARIICWSMLGLMMLSLYILETASSEYALQLAAVLQGLAIGGVLPMKSLIASSYFGTASFGKVVGYAMLAITMGSFGAFLVAWIYDYFQSYQLAFRLLLLLHLPSFIALWWRRRTERRWRNWRLGTAVGVTSPFAQKRPRTTFASARAM